MLPRTTKATDSRNKKNLFKNETDITNINNSAITNRKVDLDGFFKRL